MFTHHVAVLLALLVTSTTARDVLLVFKTCCLELPSSSCCVRCYNGSVPGPTLHFAPGETVNIELWNMLGEGEDPLGAPNTFRGVNHTNLHTHGLHVSPIEDNVYLDLPPRHTTRLTIHIPQDHTPGIFWYHPHFHGSAALQTMGGAAGAIIVEDTNKILPPPIATAPTNTVVVQFIPFTASDPIAFSGHPYGVIAKLMGDRLISNAALPTHDLWLVNGDTQPVVIIPTCTPTRVRVLFAAGSSALNLTSPGVTMSLVARDGIPLVHSPRPLANGLFIPAGGCAEVMVTAAVEGRYVVYNNLQRANTVVPLWTFLAQPTGRCTPDIQPMSLTTPLPQYLRDLRGAPVAVSQQWGMQLLNRQGCEIVTYSPTLGVMSGGFNGTQPRHVLRLGEVSRLALSGIDWHPVHLHVNPFQLETTPLGWVGDGNYATGDWMTSIQAPGVPPGEVLVTVLMRPSRYTGLELAHCHVLSHEDQGCMVPLAVEAQRGAVGRGVPHVEVDDTGSDVIDLVILILLLLVLASCVGRSADLVGLVLFLLLLAAVVDKLS